jgi:hypothetical protein
MVITGVADRVPDRIGELVHLDAAHPRSGAALAEVAKAMMQMAHGMLRSESGVELVLWPDDERPIAYYGVTDPADYA